MCITVFTIFWVACVFAGISDRVAIFTFSLVAYMPVTADLVYRVIAGSVAAAFAGFAAGFALAAIAGLALIWVATGLAATVFTFLAVGGAAGRVNAAAGETFPHRGDVAFYYIIRFRWSRAAGRAGAALPGA